jgi:hypothetical protein
MTQQGRTEGNKGNEELRVYLGQGNYCYGNMRKGKTRKKMKREKKE